MPDITMCENHTCPLRQKCYRYRAKADPYWQSFCKYKPNADGTCDYFWEIRVGDVLGR